MYSQNNLDELFEVIASMPNQILGKKSDYHFIKTMNNIWPNQVFNLSCSPTRLDYILKEIEVDDTLPNLLMCNPVTDHPKTIAALDSKNFKKSIWTAMSHDLKSADRYQSKKLSIELIESKAQLLQWIAIAEKELMSDHKLNFDIFRALQMNKNCYFFLGFIDNKPVATSLLFVGKSSAGIYLVSTALLHRKQGIGKDMTLTCLEKAKMLGCTKVDLQATGAGFQVYKSLGFKAFGAINVYSIQ